ncbi:DgyrCDS2821 [Dimorphilus gyrociliatus]|uniref:DgyrCDS2821 n=1 Tax=Dimorphilus gyrociliatus TaxID=2664684 RepID=A0A7I8VDC2_9ANNE|nr:DgyrCDS2821 [Dimorphilus gyrociliatus]
MSEATHSVQPESDIETSDVENRRLSMSVIIKKQGIVSLRRFMDLFKKKRFKTGKNIFLVFCIKGESKPVLECFRKVQDASLRKNYEEFDLSLSNYVYFNDIDGIVRIHVQDDIFSFKTANIEESENWYQTINVCLQQLRITEKKESNDYVDFVPRRLERPINIRISDLEDSSEDEQENNMNAPEVVEALWSGELVEATSPITRQSSTESASRSLEFVPGTTSSFIHRQSLVGEAIVTSPMLPDSEDVIPAPDTPTSIHSRQSTSSDYRNSEVVCDNELPIKYDGEDAVFGWEAAPSDYDTPPEYDERGAMGPIAPKGVGSLKQLQVEKLKDEINCTGGVKVILKKAICYHCLALVDALDSVWISGWHTTIRPYLKQVFHIGDQVLFVNGQKVENSKIAYQLIKRTKDDANVTFLIRRIPYATVFVISNREESQDLGIVRKGGTAEIISVVQDSLANRYGLSVSAHFGGQECNWFLTEINDRPLNLFFKRDEIEHRLQAVGQDISIVVQPITFIELLKGQLKMLKRHASFIMH